MIEDGTTEVTTSLAYEVRTGRSNLRGPLVSNNSRAGEQSSTRSSEKGCDYEKNVAVVKRGVDAQTNRRTISYDEGKAWVWADGDTQPTGTTIVFEGRTHL
jgi:hypothetical protein